MVPKIKLISSVEDALGNYKKTTKTFGESKALTAAPTYEQAQQIDTAMRRINGTLTNNRYDDTEMTYNYSITEILNA